MKEQQKPSFLKRSLVRVLAWPESPFSIISGTWNLILPTKAAKDELAAFREFTPDQRWSNAKPDWTNEKLVQERNKSCLLAYLFLFCSVMMLVSTGLVFEYFNWFQVIGAIAYSGAPFLLFAKKSIAVYAIDTKQIILIKDWLRMPSAWVPMLNSKGDF